MWAAPEGGDFGPLAEPASADAGPESRRRRPGVWADLEGGDFGPPTTPASVEAAPESRPRRPGMWAAPEGGARRPAAEPAGGDPGPESRWRRPGLWAAPEGGDPGPADPPAPPDAGPSGRRSRRQLRSDRSPAARLPSVVQPEAPRPHPQGRVDIVDIDEDDLVPWAALGRRSPRSSRARRPADSSAGWDGPWHGAPGWRDAGWW